MRRGLFFFASRFSEEIRGDGRGGHSLAEVVPTPRKRGRFTGGGGELIYTTDPLRETLKRTHVANLHPRQHESCRCEVSSAVPTTHYSPSLTSPANGSTLRYEFCGCLLSSLHLSALYSRLLELARWMATCNPSCGGAHVGRSQQFVHVGCEPPTRLHSHCSARLAVRNNVQACRPLHIGTCNECWVSHLLVEQTKKKSFGTNALSIERKSSKCPFPVGFLLLFLITHSEYRIVVNCCSIPNRPKGFPITEYCSCKLRPPFFIFQQ